MLNDTFFRSFEWDILLNETFYWDIFWVPSSSSSARLGHFRQNCFCIQCINTWKFKRCFSTLPKIGTFCSGLKIANLEWLACMEDDEDDMPNPTFVSTFWMYHQFTSKSQKRIVASLALACQEILLQPCCGLYFRPLKQAAALCEATKRDLSSKPASSLAKAASVSVVSVVNSREFWKEEECNHQNLNFNRSWGQTELPDSAMHAGGVSGGGGGYGKKDPLEVRPLLTLKVPRESQ